MTTTNTTTDLATIEPFDRRTAADLGRVEYQRFADALEALTPEEWNADTDCEGWTVRDMAGHLCGAVTTATTVRGQVSEQKQFQKRANQTGENEVDAMTAIQIEKSAGLSTNEIVDRIRSQAAAAADGRCRLPAFMAKAMKFDIVMNTIDEKWSLYYLQGTILTRDTFLHRVADLASAVGRAPVLDDHDRRIVADVAAEWARRHGEPVELMLTGPAGGTYRAGTGGPSIELDAVEFCQILSRRRPATHPLLETEVPF